MDKRITLIILLGLILSSGSCFKEDLYDGQGCKQSCLGFEGFVFDPNNGMYVNGVEVQVKHRVSSGFFSVDTNLIGQTSTDANGFFHFGFGAKDYLERGRFLIEYHKKGYLFGAYLGKRTFFSLDSSNLDIPVNADIELIPKAYLQLKMKRDYLWNYKDLSIKYDVYKGSYSHSSVPIINGNLMLLKVAGDQNFRFWYGYKKDGVQVGKADTLFIPMGDTLVYQMVID